MNIRLDEGEQDQPVRVRVLRSGDISSQVLIPIVPNYVPTMNGIAALSVPALEYRLDPAAPWSALYWGGHIALPLPAGADEVSFEIRAHDNIACESFSSYGGWLEFGTLPPSVTSLVFRQLSYNVQDNDPLPNVTVTPANLIEGNGSVPSTIQVQVTLDRPLGFGGMNGLAVPRFTLEGSGANPAVEGVDYRLPSGNVATGLVPYGTTFSFPVEVLPNSTWQGDRTFRLKSIDPPIPIEISGATVFTIAEDEAAPVLTVLPVSAPESSGQLTFTVTLGAPQMVPYTFHWRIQEGTAGAGSDFHAPGGMETIPAGSLSAPVSISIGADAIVEGDETFGLVISGTAGGPAIATAMGTILDDDRYLPQVSDASILEGNSGISVLRYTVSLQAAAVRDMVLNYTAGGGTAGISDFVPASGMVTIPAGQTSAFVEVSVNGDTLIEADETVLLNVTSTDPLVVSGTYTGTGTILHDDYGSPPIPAATLVTESADGPEVIAWFQVDMSAKPFPVTCQVSTRDDTATFTGGDYRNLNASINFAPGETSKWVAVAVTPEGKEERVERFYLDVRHGDTGEVRSAPCTIERLSITRFWQIAPSLFAIRFPTGIGQRYVVHEAASLAGPWIPSSSILTGTGFPVTQTLFSESGQGFFRVQTAPPLPPGSAAAGP